jgi:hypothetical protein
MRAEARALAGSSADIHRRCEALRTIEADANGNVLFPAIAIRERAVFVAFYADYYFTRRFGDHPEAGSVVDACLLRLFGRIHRAAGNGTLLPLAERQAFFATASAIYGELNAGISSAAC